MRYYKEVNEIGEVALLLTYNHTPNITNPLVVEITADEYKKISDELDKKANENSNIGYTLSEIYEKAKAYDIITGVIE